MRLKKIHALSMALVLSAGTLLGGCASGAGNAQTTADTTVTAAAIAVPAQAQTTTVPKYIFLFIGDGMSYPQIQTTSYYLGAGGSDGGVATEKLSFMNFPVSGSAQTYDSTSFCPDSASTATSISTGNKTYSGTINMDTSKTQEYETISEKLKSQLNYKVGIVTTVNLNHATPAAFYAHQASRNSYYEIGLELIASGFDYFAGGGLLKPAGTESGQTGLYALAEQAGYKVIQTDAEAKALTSADGKALVIAENLADSGALSYQLDTPDTQMQLADYVKKGIEVLDNDTGFFMMIEGGKVDWACHANDAASAIHEVIALDAAVEEALAFYHEHPDETLILVTGDHETGGLTIGFAGTNYDTFLTHLNNQVISYAKYDSDYVTKYKEEQTNFETVLGDIKTLFGLITKEDPDAAKDSALVLTGYEYDLLKAAYDKTLEPADEENPTEQTQEEYLLYGAYEPLSVTITHLLNNKSGIAYSSYSHTGLPVPVFAIGTGAEKFEGYYDNTDIFFNIAALTGVK